MRKAKGPLSLESPPKQETAFWGHFSSGGFRCSPGACLHPGSPRVRRPLCSCFSGAPKAGMDRSVKLTALAAQWVLPTFPPGLPPAGRGAPDDPPAWLGTLRTAPQEGQAGWLPLACRLELGLLPREGTWGAQPSCFLPAIWPPSPSPRP